MELDADLAPVVVRRTSLSRTVAGGNAGQVGGLLEPTAGDRLGVGLRERLAGLVHFRQER